MSTTTGPDGTSPVAGDVEPAVVGREAVVDLLVAAGRAGPGAVVSGRRGSGRSTVLGAAAARLGELRVPVIRLVPVAGGGAFTALRGAVPGLPASVEAGSLAEVGAALLAGVPAGEGSRPVLVVEDAEDVDAPSAAVLHQLVASGAAVLLGSTRADRAAVDSAAAWWRDLVERVHLDSLDRADADRLAEALVGGPVDAASRERLWSFARGHPGWLVTAVRTTRAAGGWERASGLWTLSGDLRDTVDPDVLSATDAAPSDVRAVLQALALAGALPIDDAEALGGPAALADAERRALVAVDTDDEGALWCRPASELVATVLRASLDPETGRARWARVAEVMAASESRAGEALVARGRALLHSGRVEEGRPAAEDDLAAVVAAAEAAYYLSRWAVGAALAERAWHAGAGAEALWLLAQCLGHEGDHVAISALADALEAADPAEAVVHVEGIAVSQFHRNDPEGAWATFARVRERADADGRVAVDMSEGRLRSFAGDQERAVALVTPWRDHPDLNTRVGVREVLATAAVQRGDYDGGIAGFEETFTLALTAPEAPMALAGVPFLLRLSACADVGRFEEAATAAEAVERDAAALGDPTAHGWLTLHLGRVALATGRSRTAVRWFGESVAALRRVHRPGWLAHPAAGLVAAHALAGDREAAAEARDRWEEIPAHPVALFRSEELRFVAWHHAADGDVEGARALLRRARDRARANRSHPYGAAAWHDLSRLGTAEDRAEAATALAELAAASSSPLVDAHATEARALADGTVAGLVTAGTAYEEMGALVDAVECWAEVSRRTTDERQHADACRRVTELRARCEDLSTPLLDDVGDRSPLTDREAEIVALVVAGAARQQIADQLVLSIRTVDSHLQRVYRKLGVRGRDEMVAVLGAGPGAAAGADGPASG